MSALFPKSTNKVQEFNKEQVIEDIKNCLPNPWVWYTIGSCMEEVDNPNYDLVVMRTKEVTEDYTIARDMSRVDIRNQSLYSIVLGLYISDTFSVYNRFDTSCELVTAAVEVKSAFVLLDILKNIDAKIGGIKNVN
jgi:hypothetical protein